MIRVNGLRLPVRHDKNDIRNAILKKLRLSDTGLLDFIIVRKSLDSRKKNDIHYIYSVDVTTDRDEAILKNRRLTNITSAPIEAYQYPSPGNRPLLHRPVVIGSGPAGLFAAYYLAREGFRPLIIERGESVEQRLKTVTMFWEQGILNPESNLQFGEGGAGTFSDGKLSSGVKDSSGRRRLVLETFVENGAPKEILYANKPHLGTDVLITILSSMRKRIIEWGGEYRFSTCFHSFTEKNGRIHSIMVRTTAGDMETIPAEIVLLAIGHSARDTFRYLLHDTKLAVTAKPFAVGVRAEHRQRDIDRAQYGIDPDPALPVSDYKLTWHSPEGRGVYSFCMCPGGYVVNSSSAPGMVCINGMSYAGREASNANAAIVAQVSPSDDPEENIRFQEALEQKAYEEGNGLIVSQRLEDFEKNRVSENFGKVIPAHKGNTTFGNIRHILPEDICRDITQAMHAFSQKISGFDDPDTLLSAVESRTSSPLRIVRNEEMETCISGLYPIGEGAGYAGGITSAAIDGIRAFEKIYGKYDSKNR